ncbi:MAG: hypothetical protein P8X75_01045 [Limibacillus sp.]|jgi:hypothetical protein
MERSRPMAAKGLSGGAASPSGKKLSMRMPSFTFPSRLLTPVLLAGLLLLSACEGYKGDIAAVQGAESATGLTNAELVQEIAGARGTYDWSAGPYVEGKDEIVLVEARIEKTDNRGEDHVIQLLWVHNRQSGKVSSEDVVIDGQSRGLLAGAMDLLLLQLE